MGNYLYCSPCIRTTFGISRRRLTRQRAVKRKQSEEPLREMTKVEVEEERVSEYVVMPASLDIAFKEWWRSLEPSHTVMVRYPHECHGNAGRNQTQAKAPVMEDVLSKFTTLQTPAPASPQFQEHLSRSVVGEFHQAQRECGRGECSNGSCHNWLKKNC